MKKILLLIPAVLLILLYGCNDETAGETDVNDSKVTAYAYKVDEIKEETLPEEPEESPVTVRLCHDTDNGIVRWEAGEIFGYYDNATRYEFKDYCQNFNWLWEFYCENETPKQEHFFCRNGCENNHCL